MATGNIEIQSNRSPYIPPNIIAVLIAALWFLAVVASPMLPEDYQIIFVVLPFVIIGGFLALLRPEWAVLATVAIIPFEKYEPSFLPESLSLMKLVGGALLATFIFNLIFRRRSFRFLDDNQDLMVVLFAVVVLFSVVGAEYADRSFNSLERIFRMILLYVAVKNLITSPQMIKTLMYITSFGFTFASWFGINQFFANRAIRIHDTRASGVFMDPNDYALLAVIALMITLTLFMVAKTNWLKALLAINTVSLAVGIVLSGSRGGLLALGAAGLVFLWKHPKRGQLLLLSIMALVISWPIWPDSIKARLGFTNVTTPSSVYTDTANQSVERRLAYAEFGLQLVADNPLLGVGYGTFPEYFARSDYVRYSSYKSAQEREAHNIYLDILFGAGFIGLLTYLALLAVVFRDLHLISAKSDYGTLAWSISVGLMSALTAFVFATFFVSSLHSETLWWMIATVAALRYFVVQNPQLLHQQEATA